MFGAKNAFINLNIYFSNLFSNNNKDLKILPINTYYLMLFLDILFYLFLVIGLKIGHLMSTRKCILISLLIQYSAFAFLYFFISNPYVILISMGIFNIGNAICFLASFTNCWKYYPKKYGLINGILLSATGFSSSILTFIGEYIINREQKEISINDNNIDIKNKIELFVKIVVCMLIFCGIFGFLLIFEFKEELAISEMSLESDKSDKSDTGTGTGNDSSCSQEVISNYNFSNNPSLLEDINLKQYKYNAIFSCKNLNLMLIAFLGLCKLYI